MVRDLWGNRQMGLMVDDLTFVKAVNCLLTSKANMMLTEINCIGYKWFKDKTIL